MKAKAPNSGFARKKTQAAHSTYPVMSGGAFSCSSRCSRSPSAGFVAFKSTCIGRSAAVIRGFAPYSQNIGLCHNIMYGFYRANSYPNAVLVVVILSVCPSVRLSVCLSVRLNFLSYQNICSALFDLDANTRVTDRQTDRRADIQNYDS